MFKSLKFTFLILLTAGVFAAPRLGYASFSYENQPSLIISNETLPDVIYQQGSADTFSGGAVQGNGFFGNGYRSVDVTLGKPFEIKRAQRPTPVTRKVEELSRDLSELRVAADRKAGALDSLNASTDTIARDYYALVAGMSAKLQSGTTRGNPDLVESWEAAQDALNALAGTSSDLARLENEIKNDAARAAVLLERVRATFNLSGARDEDHENLARVEDSVNEIIVQLDRLLNQVNDEVNRRTSYLRSERLNMQTLSLAVANGDLYGDNIKNSLFKRAEVVSPMRAQIRPALRTTPSGFAANRRPLVVIRFDEPNLQYENALYSAVSRAMQQRPDLMFDLVAVSPVTRNSAEMALSATAARKNGEAVLRSLTQMGVPLERISMNTTTSASAAGSEVHLYVR